MATLSQWLESLGLAAYTKVFVDNDVDLELLPSLSEQDLEKLGLTMGHRKRLLKAAAALGGDSAELHRPDSAAYPLVPQRESGGSGSGERRQLTVLFCDMVGFTELATSVDPEILRGVIRAYEDACAACVTRYDGFVFQRLGDGIVAFFGYPIAHEGEAERAILAVRIPRHPGRRSALMADSIPR